MWFTTLTGFAEESPEQVRNNLVLEGKTIRSKVNGKTFFCGSLETPSLGDLRKRSGLHTAGGSLRFSELVGNVRYFHADPDNSGALFQAASQFNLLEMVGPDVSPEAGIDIYEYDHTQGPACAIAAGAGTIYRNYFVEVNGQRGQSKKHQIDCLKDVGIALGNENNRLWKMKNGYALMKSKESLEEIAAKLADMEEEEKDVLRQALRVGIQWCTQVTLDNCDHRVTQAYCSALPVAYNAYPIHLWEDFAQLVLEASYEATLHAALINYTLTGNNKVFLTYLGGGVFGNKESWIFAAIRRALFLFAHTPLDLYFVSYGKPHPQMIELMDVCDTF